MFYLIAYIVNHSKDALSITSLSEIDYYFIIKNDFFLILFVSKAHNQVRLYLYDLINYLFYLRPFFLKKRVCF